MGILYVMKLIQMILVKGLWLIIVKIIYIIVINVFSQFQINITVENVKKDIIIIDNKEFVSNVHYMMNCLMNVIMNLILKKIKY